MIQIDFERLRNICLIILAGLILLFCAVGCTSTRKVNKVENKTLQDVTVSTDKQVSITDKTVTTTSETTVREVTTPGVKIQSESTGAETQSITNGDTIMAVYDKGTNTIKTFYSGKPKTIQVPGVKSTVIQADVKKDISKQTDSTGKTQTVAVSKIVEVKRNYTLVVIGVLVLMIVVGFVIYRYIKVKRIIP